MTMQEKVFIFFSTLLNSKVVDIENKNVGVVYDMSFVLAEPLPKVSFFIISTGLLKKKYTTVPVENIKAVDKIIVIKTKLTELEFSQSFPNCEFTIRKDLLDQQVVDIYNRKVIRVNDVQLLKLEHELRIAHADIGSRGLFRRLGYEKIIDFWVRLISPNSKYLSQRNLVSWKYIQPLSINPRKGSLQLTVSQQQLLEIPPADLSEIMLDLDIHERVAFLRSVDLNTKINLFKEIPLDVQKSLIEELTISETAEILQNLDPDKTVDLLDTFEPKKTKELLSILESTRAQKLSILLGYSSDSAGGLMTTEFIALTPNTSVKDALERIKKSKRDVEIYYIYVVDEENHLLGVTTIRKLITANPLETLSSTLIPKPIFVYSDNSVEEVAYLMDKYNLVAIPVVDHNKKIVGVITIDDVLSRTISVAWRRIKLRRKHF